MVYCSTASGDLAATLKWLLPCCWDTQYGYRRLHVELISFCFLLLWLQETTRKVWITWPTPSLCVVSLSSYCRCCSRLCLHPSSRCCSPSCPVSARFVNCSRISYYDSMQDMESSSFNSRVFESSLKCSSVVHTSNHKAEDLCFLSCSVSWAHRVWVRMI